jgi:phosphatidate cytidylyltransferase
LKILTKERGDMVKDSICKILKLILAPFRMIRSLFNKLIAQVHFLDPRSNTQKRIVSALILIPIALYAIFYSKDLFIFITIALAILMTSEWNNITSSAQDKKKWQIIGFFYIVLPLYAVVKIRFYDADVLFWMFAIIWTTDIFAFFVGKIFGGPKLAPEISPNKTWSGLAGGVLASAFVGFIGYLMFGGLAFFVTVSIFLSLLEQVSDLLESKIKRIFGVKDSGHIIPGHGGVLDRLDGIVLVAPAVLLLITFFPNQFSS